MPTIVTKLNRLLLSPLSGDEGNGSENNTEVSSTDTTTSNDNITDGGDNSEGEGEHTSSNETVTDKDLPKLPEEGKQPTTATLKKQGKLNNSDASQEDKTKPIGALDDLDDDSVTTKSIEDKTKEEKEKLDNEKKSKEKVEDTKDELEKGEEDKSKDKTPPVKGGRDYSKFSKEDAEILKKAPNPVFDYLKDRLPKLVEAEKELAKLKTEVIPDLEKGIVKMPETYAEHPEAYVLTQEYNQYRQSLSFAKQEERHWEEQLLLLNKGEPWFDIKDRDPNTGALILSEPIIAEGDMLEKHKIAVNKVLNKNQQHQEHFKGQLNNLREGHVGQWKRACEDVNEHCKKNFPWTTDGKQLETEIEVEIGKPKVKLGEVLKNAINLIDPRFRSHPMSQVFGHMVVANLIASQQIRELRSQVGVKKQVIKDEERAEPASGSKSGGAKSIKESSSVGSLEDMDD